jgi:pyrophosphatase PpaX
MTPLKCVIFDMDGTLTQTHRLIFDAFNFIAMKYQGKKYLEAEITAMFGPPEEGALLRVVPPESIDRVMKEYLEYYDTHHDELAQLYPGIPDVLQYLRERGIRLALFTGKGIHTTTITLKKFALEQFFDMVVTGNDVVNHKPSSEGIRKIMDRFGLQPDEVLMVGDSVGDIKASHEAGVKVAAVLWYSFAEEKVLQMNTDYVFHNVTEFLAWLRRQFD